MPEELWLSAADDMLDAVEDAARARQREADEERERQERRARTIALAAILGAATGGATASMLAQHAGTQMRESMHRVWRRFVAETRQSKLLPRSRLVLRHHADAAAAAVQFADHANMISPAGGTIKQAVNKSVRDLAANVQKLIEREVAAIQEFVLRFAGTGPQRGIGRKLAESWRMHKGIWRLSTGAHVRASARELLAVVASDKFAVMAGDLALSRIRPAGVVGRRLYTIMTREELSDWMAQLNSARSGSALASWENLGAHYGSLELYVPVSDSVNVEKLNRLLGERKARWLSRLPKS